MKANIQTSQILLFIAVSLFLIIFIWSLTIIAQMEPQLISSNPQSQELLNKDFIYYKGD